MTTDSPRSSELKTSRVLYLKSKVVAFMPLPQLSIVKYTLCLVRSQLRRLRRSDVSSKKIYRPHHFSQICYTTSKCQQNGSLNEQRRTIAHLRTGGKTTTTSAKQALICRVPTFALGRGKRHYVCFVNDFMSVFQMTLSQFFKRHYVFYKNDPMSFTQMTLSHLPNRH